MSFMIETSARHIHLTQESVEKLFGEGYQLTIRKPLSYPGQYASNERLTIVANYETVIAAKDREIAELHQRLKVAEDALKKIDNMCDGDMCKFFDDTHHCSACRYLNECQTGVAHAALAAIREKGEEDDK